MFQHFLSTKKITKSLLSMMFAVTEDNIVHFFRLPKANVDFIHSQFDEVDIDIDAMEAYHLEVETDLLTKGKSIKEGKEWNK
jgi:hypothetical protein